MNLTSSATRYASVVVSNAGDWGLASVLHITPLSYSLTHSLSYTHSPTLSLIHSLTHTRLLWRVTSFSSTLADLSTKVAPGASWRHTSGNTPVPCALLALSHCLRQGCLLGSHLPCVCIYPVAPPFRLTRAPTQCDRESYGLGAGVAPASLSLEDLVKAIKPTALIGVSTRPGTFTPGTMHKKGVCA